MTNVITQYLAPLSLIPILVACQSKQVSQSTAPKPGITTAPIDSTLLPPNFLYSFFISGGGIDDKPSDTWTIDTTGTMAVHTTKRTAAGKFRTLNGVAALDPPDADTLRMLIRIGKLYAIDSNDVTQQCAGDEHYFVKIVPIGTKTFANLSFDACAADYNLLLQPQRKYFRMLIDWWERMRVKYRPNAPE